MSLVNARIQIDAPIERVWETVMDPDRLGEWVTIHRALVAVSAKPLGKGSTMEQSMHIRGVTFKVSWTLTDVSAPNPLSGRGAAPPIPAPSPGTSSPVTRAVPPPSITRMSSRHPADGSARSRGGSSSVASPNGRRTSRWSG